MDPRPLHSSSGLRRWSLSLGRCLADLDRSTRSLSAGTEVRGLLSGGIQIPSQSQLRVLLHHLPKRSPYALSEHGRSWDDLFGCLELMVIEGVRVKSHVALRIGPPVHRRSCALAIFGVMNLANTFRITMNSKSQWKDAAAQGFRTDLSA